MRASLSLRMLPPQLSTVREEPTVWCYQNSGNHNERTQINVTVENAFNIPTNFPDFVDGATWMELYNEALLSRSPNSTVRFSPEVIAATHSGVNPYVYPDVNWKDVLFRDYAMSQHCQYQYQSGEARLPTIWVSKLRTTWGSWIPVKVHSWDNNINNWGYNFQNNITYDLTESTDRPEDECSDFRGWG